MNGAPVHWISEIPSKELSLIHSWQNKNRVRSLSHDRFANAIDENIRG